MIEYVLDTLQGKVTKKPLVSLWRHYPEFDHSPETLSQATIDDYRRFPSDLIKLSPHGRFCVTDFGCLTRRGTTERGSDGSTKCTQCVVQSIEDWDKIEEIDPNDGDLGDQIKFVKMVSAELEDVPKMMTVFSPTMVARKLSGNLLPEHLKDPDMMKSVIEKVNLVSKIMIEFSRGCIDVGAEGIFAAVQEADKSVIDPDMMKTLLSLNTRFMEEINDNSDFTVLHLHGDELEFGYATKLYKPTAVNWHDQTSWPSLLQARELFKGGLLGGLNPQSVLNGETNQAISNAHDLRKQIPLILAPGCVLLQGTKDDVLSKIFQEYRL